MRRTASKATAAGRFEEANHAWLAALARNPGDAEAARGGLRNYLRSDRKRSGLAGHYGCWLLKLTGTNRADLELVAQVLEKHEEPDLLLSLLEPRKDQLSPSLETTYLKALFHCRKIADFAARWKRARNELPWNEDLALFEAALRAGWESGAEAAQGREQLESGLERPPERLLAGRLLLTASAQRLDADRYGWVLGRLQEWQADRFADHVGYWHLLAQVGRKNDALCLAQAGLLAPTSADEVMQLAAFHAQAGQTDQALDLFRRSQPAFGEVPAFWLAYVARLIEARRWEELREAALLMRGRRRIGPALAAYSHYLEGKAELALARPYSAAAAFQKMTSRVFQPVGLAVAVSTDLFRSGHADVARALLRRVQDDFQNDSDYWSLLFRVAAELKDEGLMLLAGERAAALKPQDAITLNNYAAALLIQRQRPGEAIKITFRLLADNPDSTVAAINHAAALLLNQRLSEAEALLQSLARRRLTRTQAALCHFNLFQLSLSRGQRERAAVLEERIERQYLYPSQVRWLENARQQLAEALGSRASERGGLVLELSAN